MLNFLICIKTVLLMFAANFVDINRILLRFMQCLSGRVLNIIVLYNVIIYNCVMLSNELKFMKLLLDFEDLVYNVCTVC